MQNNTPGSQNANQNQKPAGQTSQQGSGSTPPAQGLSWSTPNQQAKQNPPVQKPLVTPQKKVEVENSNTAKYVGMIVVGIIAGVLIAWAWVGLRSPGNGTTATSTATTTNGATSSTSTQSGVPTSTGTVGTISSQNFSVPSPQKAGRTLTVDRAVVSAPTWVVVYDNNNGKPGNALGATLFFPETTSGKVALLRATVAGKSYLVAKQLDNGDRKFSLHIDQFVTEQGAVQWVSVTAN